MDTKKMQIDTYIQELASKAPIPGGGGVAGVCGALAVALSAMVCNLTIGKKKYATYEGNIRAILDEMQVHIENFLSLADEDAKVFEPLSKAYALPSDTREEKEKKTTIMEELLLDAAMVPFKILQEAIWTIPSIEYLGKYGSRLAVSDVAVSIQFLRATISATVVNICINTKYMTDREKATELNTEAKKLLQTGMRQADTLYEQILEELC